MEEARGGDAGTGVVLRPGAPDDAEAVVAVWLRALTARDAADPPDGTAARLRGVLSGREGRAIVAVRADAVVGFIIVVRGDGTDVVRYLAVDPTEAGRGLGARLLGVVVEAHPGRRLELDVRVGNARAIALYARAGFKCAGEPVAHPLGGPPMLRWVRSPSG